MPLTHRLIDPFIPGSSYKKIQNRLIFWISIAALMTGLSCNIHAQDKLPVLIDTDTGNEVDDLFAVARALIEPAWEVTALNATHWQTSHWAEPRSMENSHRLNQVLLGLVDMSVKTRRGGAARMYDWGDLAQHSAAAYEIIKQAKAMPGGEKLTVIALGALTNVASAIYIDPSIENRITLYWLGTTFDFEKGILKRTDFNCMMDPMALELLLLSEVEMHIMPLNVANKMVFNYSDTEQRLRGQHDLGNYLCDRWYQHLDGLRKERVIWDLALIGAIIHPDWAEKELITTSRDSGNRPVHYYKAIDADKMIEDFFNTLDTFMK